MACYAALSVLVYLPVWPFDSSRLPICNCGDNAMTADFLAWTPWALLHGHNPFLTTYEYFPHGADLAANTTMPVLGVLLAPVTLTAGPVVTLNLVLHLALVLSAAAAYGVLRRIGCSPPAAFAGGLLYGFSPWMLGQGQSHANLAFEPLLPVLALLVGEAVTVGARPARRAGLLIGLVALLQYGTASEMLADAAVVAAVLLALLALAHRREVRARAAHARRVALWALACFVPFAAYPVYLAFFGPQHPNGPPRLVAVLTPISSDLLGAIVPTTRQLISVGLGRIGSSYVTYNVVENGVYLGLPLLLLAVLLVRRYRDDLRLWWAAVGAAIGYVLALGPVLRVAGRDTSVPLPEAVLVHLPVLDGIVPARFVAFTFLGLSFVLAIGLDRLRADLAEAGRPLTGGRPRRAGVAAAAIAVLALAPLLPRQPYPSTPVGDGAYASYPIPPFFHDAADLAPIPAGRPAVVYPFSDPAPTAGLVDYSVLWQAVAGERFELMDGDATRPGPYGAGTEAPPPLVPVELESMMFDAYFGPYAYFGSISLHTTRFPALTQQALGLVRAALAGYGVTTVIVDPVGYDPDAFVAAVDAALGATPEARDGVLVWYGVQRDLQRIDG